MSHEILQFSRHESCLSCYSFDTIIACVLKFRLGNWLAQNSSKRLTAPRTFDLGVILVLSFGLHHMTSKGHVFQFKYFSQQVLIPSNKKISRKTMVLGKCDLIEYKWKHIKIHIWSGELALHKDVGRKPFSDLERKAFEKAMSTKDLEMAYWKLAQWGSDAIAIFPHFKRGHFLHGLIDRPACHVGSTLPRGLQIGKS